ncbi:MAG: DUF2815 family protein [Clostridiales bacterium]|nr:DUF2815 family protein [Clostridiales bacterium]
MADVTIKNVRFSYCHLFQPKSQNGSDPKYSTTVLVPKGNTAAKQAIDAAVNEAINTGVAGKWNGTRPPRPALCVYDGDGVRPSDGQPFGDECKGCWVFTASTRDKPFVVNNRVDDIIDPTQVYSGMWGNVCVSFFPYNYNGKKGIGCWLNGVQKVRDGEPLTHRVTAQSAFQVEEDSTAGSYDPITGQPVTSANSELPW